MDFNDFREGYRYNLADAHGRQGKSTSAVPKQHRSPITFYPSRGKTIALLLISLIFVVGGIATLGNSSGFDRVVIYLSITFFGFCALVFLVTLFPGSSFLRLDDTGFTFSSLFRQHTCEWDGIEFFFPVRLGVLRGPVTVGWNFLPGYQPHKGLAKVNRMLSGAQAALPQNYGGNTAQELATLMNEWRNGSKEME